MRTKSILAAVLLAGTALAATTPANATLVLSDLVFRDLGGTGFGVAPRLLTLQNNVFEAGGTVAGPGGTTIITGPDATNQSNVFSVGALGWTSGASVGIGLDTNEIGSTEGLTFNTLVLTLYNSAGVALGSFSGNGPVFIDQALLSAQQGNGNSVFDIRLDAAQQAQYDAIINNPANGGVNNIFEGLSASFGCVVVAPGCGPSSDGADSFLAFVVPGPIVGAGIPGLVSAAFGMLGFNWHRRRRNGMRAA
jgi:hypothetical protein